MILHCPCCHAQFSVETIIQDEAARELLGLKGTLPPATFSYLALFRSEKRALSWERALRLAKEIIDNGQWTMDNCQPSTVNYQLLNEAMMETIEALRGKGGAPLKNHNYLKKVLLNRGNVESLNRLNNSTPQQFNSSTASSSKTDAAMTSLEAWSRG